MEGLPGGSSTSTSAFLCLSNRGGKDGGNFDGRDSETEQAECAGGDDADPDSRRRLRAVRFPDVTIGFPAAYRNSGRHRHDEISDANRHGLRKDANRRYPVLDAIWRPGALI
jgi:hypothetical protein